MLNHGDFGADVAEWQTFLRAKGYCSWEGRPLRVTGEFDDDTEFATARFQRDQGLAETGILCPQTESLARAMGWLASSLPA
ncbi:MAG TPA: peptidoglycan-binding domain-containing protein [Polyangiaceae bacterium]|nr:peptidoglycan-binding domain-containing protein [Polyangiaceae bacterium]